MQLVITKNGGDQVSLDIEHGFDVDELFARAKAAFNAWPVTNQAVFMDDLRKLAAGKRVVEFGYGEGQSAFIFLCGRPQWVFSHDILPSSELKNLDALRFIAAELGSGFAFFKANTAELPAIPECDVLLIDSRHTYDHVMDELKHAPQVKETIIFHDTTDDNIMRAVIDFQSTHKNEWKLEAVRTEDCGIAYLKRVVITDG
jgi:hypothetical protein